MSKTPDYVKRANNEYKKRKRQKGWITFERFIRPEWKPVLDKLIHKLKEKENE